MKRIGVPAVTTATCSLLIASGIFISSFANAAGTGHVPAGPKADAPAPAGQKADAPAPAGPKADAHVPAGQKADAPAPAGPKADAHVPAGPKVHAPAAATVGSAQAGLQLALADAKANLQQALAAAGNDKILKKEARAQYKAQVTAINKAIATTQN